MALLRVVVSVGSTRSIFWLARWVPLLLAALLDRASRCHFLAFAAHLRGCRVESWLVWLNKVEVFARSSWIHRLALRWIDKVVYILRLKFSLLVFGLASLLRGGAAFLIIRCALAS